MNLIRQKTAAVFIFFSLCFCAFLLSTGCKSTPKPAQQSQTQPQNPPPTKPVNDPVEVYFEKGQQALGEGKFGLAMFYFDSAVVIKTDDARLWERKGSTYYRLNRYSDAEGCFNTALKLDPRNKSALWNSARNYSMQKKKDETLERLKRLLMEDRMAKHNIVMDPSFEWLRESPEFKKLTQ